MNKAQHTLAILVIAMSLFMAACGSKQSTVITPSLSSVFTKTPNPMATATLTTTETPTAAIVNTSTPSATATPIVPNFTPSPVLGAMYYDWLKPSGIAVFAGNVVLCNNDYFCPGEAVGPNAGASFELGRWNPNNPDSQFVFAGQADVDPRGLRDIIIKFPKGKSFTDVVILFSNLAIDYIAGILSDGRQVPFNYTFNNDGVLVSGSNFMETWTGGLNPISSQSHNRTELLVCGIAGIEPDGSYSNVDGGILFRMPKATFSFLQSNPDALWGERGADAYNLIGIRIVYDNKNNVAPDSICR